MQGSEPPPKALPPGAAERLGTTVDGKYRLRDVIGVGGMGIVYEAEHLFLGRTVALKVLHPRYADMQQWAARFQKEARAAGSIVHRAVVQVMDAGFVDGTTPYLVMERLTGESLETRIHRRGGIRVVQAALVLREMMRGLAAAHGKGIVHCDLKPANVFVVDKRIEVAHIKLLDFGISRIAQGPLSSSGSRTDTGKHVLGTPTYMAPEQITGDEVTSRTDLYGAGAVVYEALAARPPFEGADKVALFSAIMHAPMPPVVGKREPVPAPLAQLVHRLLSRSPDNRPASAQDVVAELDEMGLLSVDPNNSSARYPMSMVPKRKG